MYTLISRLLGAAVVTLLALGLVSCGDDGGPTVDAVDIASAPESAGVDDFCEVWNDDMGVSADASSEEVAHGLHEGAERLAEVGTPEALSEAERNGFETFVAAMTGIDADGVEQFQQADGADDLAAAFQLSAEESQELTAFLGYAATACV